MFLDASVIVANLLEEPEAPLIRASLVDESEVVTSPLAIFEASTRLAAEGRFLSFRPTISSTWTRTVRCYEIMRRRRSTIPKPKTGRGVNSPWSAFILRGTRHRTAVIGEWTICEVINT